jgi:putative DNA primase/helicase
MAAETLMVKKNEAHPTETARLRGARLVIAIETKAGRRFDENHVKSLTGGDPLTGRFMRQDFFDFVPSHKIFLAVNHLPEITDTTESFWRRVYLTPWDVTIPEAEQDKDLEDKIVQAELPGVLAWAVQGCLAWQQEGLNPPEAVKVAKDEYRAEQDQLSLFIKAHLVLGSDLTVPVADLHRRYAEWFVRTAPNPADNYTRRDTATQLNLRALCDKLIETLRVSRCRIGHAQTRGLKGCGLTSARQTES